jgi:hypothetical protein
MSFPTAHVNHSHLQMACIGLCFLLCLPVKSPSLAADDVLPNRIVGKHLVIARDQQSVSVTQGDRLLFQYRYGGVSHKPYVARLASPSGVNVLRDAPADHLHHHGLMFAWHVGGVNFWEERPDSGRQIHDSWSELRVTNLRIADTRSTEVAVLREQLRWEGPNGEMLLEEERLLAVPPVNPQEPTCLTWQSTLTAPRESKTVTITGTNYSGLGARFLPAMDVNGSFRNDKNATGVTATNAQRASWCAYTARPGPDASVTVAMFDAVSNARHPAIWFTMDEPFAYLAATLGLDTRPAEVLAGQPLTLRYGVAVFDGDVDRAAVDAAHVRWQELIFALGNDEISASKAGKDD